MFSFFYKIICNNNNKITLPQYTVIKMKKKKTAMAVVSRNIQIKIYEVYKSQKLLENVQVFDLNDFNTCVASLASLSVLL